LAGISVAIKFGDQDMEEFTVTELRFKDIVYIIFSKYGGDTIRIYSTKNGLLDKLTRTIFIPFEELRPSGEN
jgi:hypothetical protein